MNHIASPDMETDMRIAVKNEGKPNESLVAVRDEHTPGPWEARLGQYSYTNDGQRPIMACEQRIALVTSTIERTRKTAIDAPDGERDANARLIAAAPELLQALQLAHEHLSVVYPNAKSGDDFLLDTISAALAKAAQS